MGLNREGELPLELTVLVLRSHDHCLCTYVCMHVCVYMCVGKCIIVCVAVPNT